MSNRGISGASMRSANFLPILLTLVIGCATSSGGMSPFQRIDPVPSGQAVVYFYRFAESQGRRTYDIFLGQEKVGSLKDQEYFVYVAPPGKATFSLDETFGDTPITKELKDGKEYFVSLYHDGSSANRGAFTAGSIIGGLLGGPIGGGLLGGAIGAGTFNAHIRFMNNPCEALDSLQECQMRK